MKLYFAPMEGITDVIFRQVFQAQFGGVDKYFMPFVSPSSSLSYTVRQDFELSPEQNRGFFAVPQILAKDPLCFLGAARGFADSGYTEVNLNLGCPSGTVTGKGKGSGMLRDVDGLKRFLDQVYGNSPLPVSIKTRIGFDTPAEWEKLLPVFAVYPIHELIIHPRTRGQLYRGTPYRETFARATETLTCPLVYNGDLFTVQDVQQVQAMFPAASGLMLGRGVLTNPALLREIRGGAPLAMGDLIRYHDRLYYAYMKTWKPLTAVGRMHVFVKYLSHSLDVPAKYVRQAMKETRPEAYLDAVAEMFRRAQVKEVPCYSQQEYAMPAFRQDP